MKGVYPGSALSRQRTFLFIVVFVSYVGYYFCRVTLPVALPVLQETFQFSKTDAGWILTSYYTVYAASKLLNGFLGDRMGGKALMLVGIAGSAVCNLLFGAGHQLGFFVVIWGLNAYFQSMGWLSLVPIMSRWYAPHETGKAMGIMSLSYQAGDFVTRSSAGLLLATLGWVGMFWGHAGVLLGIGLLVLLFLRPNPPETGVAPTGSTAPEVAATPKQEGPDGSEYRSWLWAMLRSTSFWTVCFIYLCLSTIRYVFWGWSVDYLAQSGAGIGMAALGSAFFPLLGSLGTISAGWISDRMGARRGPVIVVMSGLMTVSIYLFSQVSPQHPVWPVAALGLVGFTLYGPYSLMAGAIAIDFGSKYASATAAGVIDSVGALGSIATGVGMGFLIDRYGWNNAFLIVLAIGALSTLASLRIWHLRPASR